MGNTSRKTASRLSIVRPISFSSYHHRPSFQEPSLPDLSSYQFPIFPCSYFQGYWRTRQSVSMEKP